MNGILWQGASKFDGKPIAAILTGSEASGSKNKKTGAMQQVYIIRSDINALDAVKTGADRSVCGDCPNRGNHKGKQRACYVSIFRGPNAVSKKLLRGGHKPGAKINPKQPTRLGAYGDPGLIPIECIRSITANSSGWTGYTQMWKKLPRDYAKYLMASVNSEEDAEIAKGMGYRSFYAVPIGSKTPVCMLNCPASEEAGHLVQCKNCLKCNGGTGKDIWIRAHGRGKNFVK